MYEFVTEKTLNEYEAFIEKHPRGHFCQSSLWGRQKNAWDFHAVIVRGEDGRIRGGMGALIRQAPVIHRSMLYICRGPVCNTEDGQTLAELMEGAKALAKKYHGYVIKIDPDVPVEDLAFRDRLMGLGFHRLELGDGFKSAQPRFVFRLDLRGKTEEDLMAGLSQKHRYNLRLAARRGVKVHICGQEMVPAFSSLMEQTAARDGFTPRGQGYFSSLLKNLGEHARLYMAFFQGQPIAGAIAIHFGGKVWYLYGASANVHRNAMPNYPLQWAMICWGLETGSDTYDFRGISGNLDPKDPLYGLYQFKRGFGGAFTEFVGEMDLVLRPWTYRLVNAAIPLWKRLGASSRKKTSL